MAQRQRNAIPGCLHPGPYTCKASQVLRKGKLQRCRECYDAARRTPTAVTAPVATRIVEFIRENPYATYKDIAKATGVSVRNLPQNLHRIEKRGLIRRRLNWEAVE